MSFLEDNVTRSDYRLQIALDPTTAPVGHFQHELTINATSGKTPLTFTVVCRGTVLPRVVAKPKRIVRIRDSFPEHIDIVLRLEAVDESEVVVQSVTAEGIDIIDWSQKRDSKTQDISITITIALEPTIKNKRVDGALSLRLAHPPKVTVNIPVLLIELHRSGK